MPVEVHTDVCSDEEEEGPEAVVGDEAVAVEPREPVLEAVVDAVRLAR